MLHQLLRPAFLIFAVTLPLWFLFRYFRRRYKKNENTEISARQELLYFFCYIYFTCVLIITVVPVPMTRSGNVNRINFLPIVTTTREFLYLVSHKKYFMISHWMENTIGNVLLFIPLGIILPLAFKYFDSFKKVILTSFLFSISIESIQFFSTYFGSFRSVDIDDIILNTLGGFFGYIFKRSFTKKSIYK